MSNPGSPFESTTPEIVAPEVVTEDAAAVVADGGMGSFLTSTTASGSPQLPRMLTTDWVAEPEPMTTVPVLAVAVFT